MWPLGSQTERNATVYKVGNLYIYIIYTKDNTKHRDSGFLHSPGPSILMGRRNVIK